MSREALAITPSYPINGVGPYPYNNPYTQGALRAFVELDESLISLEPSEYLTDPLSSNTVGNIVLTGPSATAYDGGTLYILRQTDIEQGFAGQSARENGLAAQLDWMTEAIQDTAREVRRSLRSTVPLEPGILKSGRTVLFDADLKLIPGPSTAEIKNAANNAQTSLDAAVAAQKSAIEAAQFDEPKFATFEQMAEYPNPVDGKSAVFLNGFNGEREGFEFKFGSTLPTSAFVVNGVGGQWISRRKRYSGFVELMADTRGYEHLPEGAKTKIRSFDFEVVGDDVSNADFENAAGVKFYAIPMFTGDFNVKQFGAPANGVDSDSLAFQRAANACLRNRTSFRHTDTGDDLLPFSTGTPAILVPSGSYVIPEGIAAASLGYLNIKALGKPVIRGNLDDLRTSTFITAGSTTENGNLRYLNVEGIEFINFDGVVSANTTNLDSSRWNFKNCWFDGINLVLDSHSYVRSRSTLCTFDECYFGYRVTQITRVFFDKLNFNKCWIGSGTGSGNMIYANSFVTIDECMLIPAGTAAAGRSIVYLTNDDGVGGRLTTEPMRGVTITNTRASNEAGQGPLVVNDFPVTNINRNITPIISIDGCVLVGSHGAHYESGGTETGIVHLRQWPASVSFGGTGFVTLGNTTSALVSKDDALTDAAPQSFCIDVDDDTYRNAQRAVGEASTYRIARSLRGYIRNPDPATLVGSGMWEDGHIPIFATATDGQKKATMKLFAGFSATSLTSPLVFDLFLGGQGTFTSNNNAYAGASSYRVTVSGLFSSGVKLRVKVEKISGDTFGPSDLSNCDIVSAHWGTADTGSDLTSTVTTNDLTFVFGSNIKFGRAKIVPAFSNLVRFNSAVAA
jgi:hypothetical protein